MHVVIVVRRHSNIQKKNIPPFRPPSTILNLLMAKLQLKIPSNIKIEIKRKISLLPRTEHSRLQYMIASKKCRKLKSDNL